MIAIGTPFIELLNQDELNLTQYCTLYCYAYDKIYLMREYKEVEIITIPLDDLKDYGLDANMMKPLLGKLVVE